MNIYFTKGFSPYLLSIEDKSFLSEGQTEFETTQQSPWVTGVDATCTKTVYDAIKDKVGTMDAPALIDTKDSPVYPNRQNVYVDTNGSLKLI